jgi:hypothetical protein
VIQTVFLADHQIFLSKRTIILLEASFSTLQRNEGMAGLARQHADYAGQR